MEDEKKTQVDSSTTDVKESESSAEEAQEETQDADATAQKAPEKEVPFHEHPRWKEVIDENRSYRQQVMDLNKKLVEITEKVTTPQTPNKDPYDGLTQEEKTFYQNLDNRTKSIIQAEIKQARQEAKREYEAEISVLKNEYGKMAANEFLKANPDIKRGSEELREIVEVARTRGLDLEDAKKIVMFDKAQETAAQREREKYKQNIQKKQAANVETKTVSKESPISKESGNIEDIFAKAEKEGGYSF